MEPPDVLGKEYVYPKAVFFIISNEFCERFTYYGMKTILVLFLSEILMYSDEESTVIYHSFSMLCYFFPLIGAIIADSYLGKYRTIFYLSILYVIGNIVISLSSTPAFGLPQRLFSLLGLLFIAMGTGGIKPCVSSFGGDQFILPQQAKQLAQFFSIFYFSINAGSLISTYLTPILRLDVHCLGENSCYPLAFGVPALLMIVSLAIFIAGKRFYIIKEPQENIIVKSVKCVTYALRTKLSSKGSKKDHWLDYAENKFDRALISDVKAVLKILVLFIPLPVFWALFDQQGSRWTFQATMMDGRLKWFTIKPDQMQVVNPLLILAFIPLFESVVYPALSACRLLTRPLQRLTTGGLLAAVAFIVSALIEMRLETTYAVLPTAGTSQIRLYNGINCNANITSAIDGMSGVINRLGVLEAKDVPYVNTGFELSVQYGVDCGSAAGKSWSGNVSIADGQAVSYFINYMSNSVSVSRVPGYDSLSKSSQSYPRVRVLYNVLTNATSLKLADGLYVEQFSLKPGAVNTDQQELLQSGTYTAYIDSQKVLGDINLEPAGVYTLVISGSENNTLVSSLNEMSPHNSVHILWLLPQYIIITAAEIMFSITGLEFSFTQAPVSMKALISAAWLLTVSFGNLIVVVISEAKFFESQAKEFLLFAALMVADMVIFMIMAIRYKYYVPEKVDTSELAEKEHKSNNS